MEVEPFFRTLKQSGYQGDTVMFCNSLEGDTLHQLGNYGVVVVPYSEEFPYLSESDNTVFSKNQSIKHLGFWCLRMYLYYIFLTKNKYLYNSILLSDVRDVVFQGDPFDFKIQGLEAFTERDDITLLKNTSNYEFLISALGKEIAAEIASKPIACAGTIFGTVSAILSFLELFLNIVTTQCNDISQVTDQSVYNYIVHKGLIPETTLHYNKENIVLTVGLDDRSYVKSGKVTNKAGISPLIVHQYERHWRLIFLLCKPQLIIWYLTKELKKRSLLNNIRLHVKQFIKGYAPRLFHVIKS